MKKWKRGAYDLCLTVLILGLCFGAGLLMQYQFDIAEHVTTVFVFAVFLISYVTEGYLFGIAAAFAATLIVNYAFTKPYFVFNFVIQENFFSAVVMIVLSLLTSAMTTKIRHQEAMKAEIEKERMRANLLRGVSHDLRTPLTTIYGSSVAMLENEDTLTPGQKRQMLKGIRDDAQWLVQIVENLLSVTRIDSGKVKIIKTSTVLDELVDSVLLKFKKRYPQQTVTLQIPEEIVVIPMDAILIEQVLTNLLENAVKHAQGMTELILRVSVKGNQAVFEVIDDGCGIPRERLEQIFSGCALPEAVPADNQKRSAGIGLSVCASIIRAHGGIIEACNRPEGGAVFRFALNTEETEDE